MIAGAMGRRVLPLLLLAGRHAAERRAGLASGSPWGSKSVAVMDVNWVERQDGVYRIAGRTEPSPPDAGPR